MKFPSLLVFLLGTSFCHAQDFFLFTGTYTSEKSKGIYVHRFNASDGSAKAISIEENVENPSYLAISPSGRFLYAVNENGGEKPGEVSAFSFDHTNGKLSFINKQTTGGDHPCYLSVDESGKWLLVGNYSGGNLSVFPLNDDGSIMPATQSIQHKGESVNKQRQEKAHVHAVVFSPDQKYVLTPDLGIDKVMIYRFDEQNEKPLSENDAAFGESKAGSGPRHISFHPALPYVYLMEELSGTVTLFHFENGKLEPKQTISSHPENFKGKIGSADIHVSPDGKFLYASNRGDANSIAIFSIDASTGLLKSVGFQSTLGKTPRNFVIDPSGNYLLVANQDSDNVVVFKRNKQTGGLLATGREIKIPNPVCLKLIPSTKH
jgi:6-phosphogluconolactonase